MIKAYSKFLDILEKIQRIILTVSVPMCTPPAEYTAHKRAA